MSQQQIVVVIGFEEQESGVTSVLKYYHGDAVDIVFCGFSRNAWWIQPHLKASKIKLITEVKTDLPWQRVDAWINGSGFTNFMLKSIITQSKLDEEPHLVLVNDKLLELDGFKRVLKALWPKVDKQPVGWRIMEFHNAEEYQQYLLRFEDFLIEELELGVRAYNVLKRAGIRTVGELGRWRLDKLGALPDVTPKVVAEITFAMQVRGIMLI
jgi:Bacterial RNA polymerase, alpha chain C terminal domain